MFTLTYLNIFQYSNIYSPIYSFGKHLFNFEATNIFGFSFVKEKLHLLHKDAECRVYIVECGIYSIEFRVYKLLYIFGSVEYIALPFLVYRNEFGQQIILRKQNYCLALLFKYLGAG